MKLIKFSLICLVIIMLTSLAKAFPFSKSDRKMGHERTIQLSNNTFSLSMPENFSQNMPADDLVERIDLSNKDFLQSPYYGNLLKRWWDIKEPGFFGKDLGTLMMAIAVRKVPENKLYLDLLKRKFDISQRLDFILALNEQAQNTYKDLDQSELYISSIMQIIGTRPETMYHDRILNNQVWTWHTVLFPDDSLLVVYALPTTKDTYLEVSFTYAHNDNVAPVPMRHQADEEVTNRILNTFKFLYSSDNPISEAVNKAWLDETTEKAIQSNFSLLLKRLYNKTPQQLEEEAARYQEEYEQSLKALENSQSKPEESLGNSSQ